MALGNRKDAAWSPFRQAATVAALGMSLAGCAAFSGPAPSIYDISAPAAFGNVGSSGIQLAVTEPTVVGALDGQRIVVRPSPTEVTFLANSQWSANTSRLVQARLIEAFQNSEGIRSVGLPGGAVVNDAGLVSNLHAFHIDAAARIAVIDISVKLVGEQSGRVIASNRFKASVPVSGDSAEGMIAALNAAFDQAAGEIVAWTLARV